MNPGGPRRLSCWWSTTASSPGPWRCRTSPRPASGRWPLATIDEGLALLDDPAGARHPAGYRVAARRRGAQGSARRDPGHPRVPARGARRRDHHVQPARPRGARDGGAAARRHGLRGQAPRARAPRQRRRARARAQAQPARDRTAARGASRSEGRAASSSATATRCGRCASSSPRRRPPTPRCSSPARPVPARSWSPAPCTRRARAASGPWSR